jgi:hypothetical protein
LFLALFEENEPHPESMVWVRQMVENASRSVFFMV